MLISKPRQCTCPPLDTSEASRPRCTFLNGIPGHLATKRLKKAGYRSDRFGSWCNTCTGCHSCKKHQHLGCNEVMPPSARHPWMQMDIDCSGFEVRTIMTGLQRLFTTPTSTKHVDTMRDKMQFCARNMEIAAPTRMQHKFVGAVREASFMIKHSFHAQDTDAQHSGKETGHTCKCANTNCALQSDFCQEHRASLPHTHLLTVAAMIRASANTD